MGAIEWWDCVYCLRHYDRWGNLKSEEHIKNMLVTEGEDLIVEILFRGSDDLYLPDGQFYIGLYSGVISRSTTLVTLPGEPSGYGYSRQAVERSNVGWPTKDKDENGYWRLFSKEVAFTADGGNIGPISGGFLCTVNSGTAGKLISAVSSQVERVILNGETMTVSLGVRCK